MTKTTLTLLAALSAASAIAAPALAQYGPPPPPPGQYGPPPPGGFRPGDWDIGRRIQWTQDRINRGRGDGSLDRHEFHRVQGQLNHIRNDFGRARYQGGGRIDDRARDFLADRLNHLNDEIHWLRDNGDRRPW